MFKSSSALDGFSQEKMHPKQIPQKQKCLFLKNGLIDHQSGFGFSWSHFNL